MSPHQLVASLSALSASSAGRRSGVSWTCMVGEAGFEPAKAWPPDLQSGLVGRLSIPPWESAHRPERGPNATLLTLRQPRVYRVQSAERRFRHLPVQVSFSVSRQGDKSPGRFRTTSGMFYLRVPRGANGASGGTRTRNRLITNQELCQLKLRWPPGSCPKGEALALGGRES